MNVNYVQFVKTINVYNVKRMNAKTVTIVRLVLNVKIYVQLIFHPIKNALNVLKKAA